MRRFEGWLISRSRTWLRDDWIRLLMWVSLYSIYECLVYCISIFLASMHIHVSYFSSILHVDCWDPSVCHSSVLAV